MHDSKLAAIKTCYLIARKTRLDARFNNRQLYVKGRSDVAEEIKRWALKSFGITEEQWRQIGYQPDQLSLLTK